jgi:hypothetical protein
VQVRFPCKTLNLGKPFDRLNYGAMVSAGCRENLRKKMADLPRPHVVTEYSSNRDDEATV